MKKKRYAVDVYWPMARSFEVEASSPDEAENKVNEMFENGRFTVADGFEPSDDIETRVSGEENDEGEIEFY